MNPTAIANRMKRLHDPEFAEKESAACQRSRRKRIGEKKKAKLESRFDALTNHTRGAGKALYLRIVHHLTKGRDATDIAIREGILVSRVVSIIASIQGAK